MMAQFKNFKEHDFQRIGWSFADQALLSLTNFATAILLARISNHEEFGIYVLIFSYLLLTQSVQSALITAPMPTLIAYCSEAGASEYFGSLLKMQLIYGGGVSILGMIIALSIFRNWAFVFILSLGLLIYSWQCQEFIRKLLFAKIDVRGALYNDIVGHGLQLCLIISGYMAGILTLQLTVLIMGLTTFVATVWGLYQCKDYFRWNSHAMAALSEHWNFGRWLLASNTLIWTSSQSFNYLSALIIGLQGPAVLQACSNIMGPTNIILNGMENIVPPAAAKKNQSHGIHGLKKYLNSVGIAGLLGLIAYVLAAGIFSERLLDLLYRGTYNSYSQIVWLIGASYVFSYFMRVNAIGLRTLLKTKPIFVAYLVSTVVTIFAGIPLIIFFSIEGAALGGLLAAATTAAIIVISFRKVSKKLQGQA